MVGSDDSHGGDSDVHIHLDTYNTDEGIIFHENENEVKTPLSGSKKTKRYYSDTHLESPGAFLRRSRERDSKVQFKTEADISAVFTSSPQPTYGIKDFGKSVKRSMTCNKNTVLSLIPSLDWLPKYKLSFLKNDIVAGLTVGFVLVPQSVAYGLLANLPPFYGLYTAMMPLFTYIWFGTSSELNIGPFALVSLLVAESTSKFAIAEDDVQGFVDASVVLSFYVGSVLLLFALLRIGFMVSFLSNPVLSGFTTAAAFLILTSQIQNLFGFPIPRGDFSSMLGHFFTHLNETNWVSLLLGLSGILLLFIIKKINNKYKFTIPLPGELIVLIYGISITYFGNLSSLSTLGKVPAQLPIPDLPQIQNFSFILMFQEAFVLAVIIYVISSSIAMTFAAHHHYNSDPNQELVALGMANLVGSLFLSYPVCGSLSRSAIVDSLGSSTPLYSLFAVFVIVITVLFLTTLLSSLPHTILASIIFFSLKSLIFQLKEPVRLWPLSVTDFLMWVVTFISTLFFGTTFGLISGSIFSLVVLVHGLAKPHYSIMGQLENTDIYRNTAHFPDAKLYPGLLIFRFDSSLIFLNKDYFRDKLKKKIRECLESNDDDDDAKDKIQHSVVLDCGSINTIDVSALDMLKRLADELDVQLYMCNCRYWMRRMMEKTKFYDLVPRVHMFVSTKDAVNAALLALGNGVVSKEESKLEAVESLALIGKNETNNIEEEDDDDDDEMVVADV